MNPYVFVFGCPRSGTTVVQRILDANPSLCMFPSEQKWIVRYLEQTPEEKIDEEMSLDLLSKLLEEDHPVWMKRCASKIEEILAERVSFREFIVRVFDLYGETRKIERVGNKNPRIAFHISRMSALWPSARFVHIIRDGRDVSLSVNTWRKLPQIKRRFPDWDKNPSLYAALWWKGRVLMGRESGSLLGPDRYYEIRYEALVGDPPKESERLCEFLSIPYNDHMIRFHEGRMNEQGRDAKKKWLPITKGLRDWQTQMAPGDIESFEVASGDLLQTLGYSRAFNSFSPEKLEEALIHQQQFPQLKQRNI